MFCALKTRLRALFYKVFIDPHYGEKLRRSLKKYEILGDDEDLTNLCQIGRWYHS